MQQLVRRGGVHCIGTGQHSKRTGPWESRQDGGTRRRVLGRRVLGAALHGNGSGGGRGGRKHGQVNGTTGGQRQIREGGGHWDEGESGRAGVCVLHRHGRVRRRVGSTQG
jgi:hypothetical protein